MLDEDPVEPLNVLLIYSGFSVPKSEQFNGDTGTWDREHLWPQSFGIIALSGSSRARSDLFNLRPINTSASHGPFPDFRLALFRQGSCDQESTNRSGKTYDGLTKSEGAGRRNKGSGAFAPTAKCSKCYPSTGV